jgi:hypothetical protein
MRALAVRLLFCCMAICASLRAAPVLMAQSAAAPSAVQTTATFPHAKHDKLFPQCSSCHAGVPAGDRAAAFPDSALCGQCHNGRDQKKVTWAVPHRTATLLRFSHTRHNEVVGATGTQCTTCHADKGAKWMHVERATMERCQSCHTHKTSEHLGAENRCSTCHLTLVQSKELSAARISAFPKPESHKSDTFARQHGAIAGERKIQCATCHSRESCARCHVNASSITAQFGLAPDPRVAVLMAGRLAEYGIPVTHRSATFRQSHGALARANVATCAHCHARASCEACHTGTNGADVIAQVPVAEPGGASGATIKSTARLTAGALPWRLTPDEVVPTGRIAIGSVRRNSLKPPIDPRDSLKRDSLAKADTAKEKAVVHPPGYARNHGVQASTSQPGCDGCHTRTYCAECHAGESSRRFHVSNFVMRHAPEAWGRDMDCQQCHNREVFCRGCHVQVGLSSKGRSNVGYHSAIPLWPLQHGQAARQGLQSCTSCHTQKDCMQCHAQGGRGINPHGPDFDARRMWKANRLTCLRCHLKDPLDSR